MDAITHTLAAIPRFVVWIAIALGVLSALAAVAAAVEPHWVEELLGVSPDGGSGGAETELALAFGAAAVILLAGSAAAGWAARRLRHNDFGAVAPAAD